MDWTKTHDNLRFHCTLGPIRRRRAPYANEPGSPWMGTAIDVTSTLTQAQARRLIDAFQGATNQMTVYSAHYHSVHHEPGNS